MVNYSDRSVRARIIVAGVLLPVIIICPMLIAFHLYFKDTAIQSHLDKAKAVCLTAKSLYPEQGCEFIPVTAVNKDFDLSFADRRLFDQNHLSGESLKDFYLFDDSKNLLCYTAFIRARKSCLDCHGDPGKSKKLWVENDTAKSVPVHLSGLNEGDIFGAYEVIIPFSKAGKKGIGGTFIAGIMLLAGISIYTISFFAVVSYVINQHGYQEKDASYPDWQIYDLDQSTKDTPVTGNHVS